MKNLHLLYRYSKSVRLQLSHQRSGSVVLISCALYAKMKVDIEIKLRTTSYRTNRR